MKNLEKLTIEEAEALSESIGSKVRNISDNAIEKANKILSKYGMQAKMSIIIQALDNEKLQKDNLTDIRN